MMRKTTAGWHVLDGDGFISKWVEQNGRLDHDRSAIPIITKYIPKGGVAVDVGANIGSHCIAYLEAVGSEGRVYAFEPHRDSFECLTKNCPTAISIPIALGDIITTCQLAINLGNPGASFLCDAASEAIDGSFRVPVVPLDYFLLPRVDYIKIDAEGSEFAVLCGAARTIERCRPVMVIEINESALDRQHTTPGELLELIESYRYEYDNIYPKEPCSGPQYDVLCLPK